MALAPQVLGEYAHVVTDPRRFERPLAMETALSLASRFWLARECRRVAADGEAVAVFLDWMVEHRLGRKRLLDTLPGGQLPSRGCIPPRHHGLARLRRVRRLRAGADRSERAVR